MGLFKDRKKEHDGLESSTIDAQSNRKIQLNGYTIWWNRGVELCAEACSVCWDKKLPGTYEGLVGYLERRLATGHTSILEHSNIAVLLNVPIEQVVALLNAIDSMRYLKHIIHQYDTVDGYAVLIGGSYRAYRDFMQTCAVGNPIKDIITECIAGRAPREIFADIIDAGYMIDPWTSEMKPMVASKENDECYRDDENYIEATGVNSKILLANMTNINAFLQVVSDCTLEPVFSLHDCLPMMTATVCFYDLSRAGTHQLVRHRNGITQESQRYVDYSQALFTNPADLKPEKYDKDAKYPIDLKCGDQTAHFDITLGDLGILVQSIYPQLRHPADDSLEPLIQEDARAYLPTNIKCRKIYITYTLDYLMRFFILRQAPGAQIEIRNFANTLHDAIDATENKSFFSADNLEDLCGSRLAFEAKYPKPETQVDEPLDTEAKLAQYQKYIQTAGIIDGDDKEEKTDE